MSDKSNIDILGIVRKCLEQTDGKDTKAAAKVLQREMKKDPQLYRVIMSEYEAKACLEIIQAIHDIEVAENILEKNNNLVAEESNPDIRRVVALANANAKMYAQQILKEAQRKVNKWTKKKG